MALGAQESPSANRPAVATRRARLDTEEAERTGLDLALATLLARVFTETTEAGWGDLDTAVVQRWVESRARA